MIEKSTERERNALMFNKVLTQDSEFQKKDGSCCGSRRLLSNKFKGRQAGRGVPMSLGDRERKSA